MKDFVGEVFWRVGAGDPLDDDGRGVCGRRRTSGIRRPDQHVSVALGRSLNLDQFFDQVFEGLVVHAELSAQGTDRYATVFLQVGFGVADDVEKGQRELSNPGS